MCETCANWNTVLLKCILKSDFQNSNWINQKSSFPCSFTLDSVVEILIKPKQSYRTMICTIFKQRTLIQSLVSCPVPIHIANKTPQRNFFYYISDTSLTYDEPIFWWIAESVTQAIVQSNIQLIDPKVHNKKQKLVGAISVIKRSRWHSGRTAQ